MKEKMEDKDVIISQLREEVRLLKDQNKELLREISFSKSTESEIEFLYQRIDSLERKLRDLES